MLSSILRPRPCLSPLHKTVFNFVTYVCPIQNIKNWKEKKKTTKNKMKQQQKKKQPTPLELFLHVKRRTLKSLFKK